MFEDNLVNAVIHDRALIVLELPLNKCRIEEARL